MIKCEICGRECKNFLSLGIHLSVHKEITAKEYYDRYFKKPDEGICPECGKKTNFNKISKGYRKFCSYKCSGNSNETREKYKNTCIEEYGFENTFQVEEFKEKSKRTMLTNHGVEYPAQSTEIREKQKQTSLDLYGNEYPIGSSKIIEKRISKRLDTFYKNILVPTLKENNIEPLFTAEEYNGTDKTYKFKCLIHNFEFERPFFQISQLPMCPLCSLEFGSKVQKELYNYTQSLTYNKLIPNKKNIFSDNREIDIFIPSKNIAIEFNGIYWHSNKFVSKNYHFNKFKDCFDQNIHLIQIFEDEWKKIDRRIIKFFLENTITNSEANLLITNENGQNIISLYNLHDDVYDFLIDGDSIFSITPFTPNNVIIQLINHIKENYKAIKYIKLNNRFNSLFDYKIVEQSDPTLYENTSHTIYDAGHSLYSLQGT